MNQQQAFFRIDHSMATKMKYFLSIVKDLNIKRQFQEIISQSKNPLKSQMSLILKKIFERANQDCSAQDYLLLAKLFQNVNSQSTNMDQLNNFITILMVRLTQEFLKIRKDKNIQQELIKKNYFLKEYQTLQDRTRLMQIARKSSFEYLERISTAYNLAGKIGHIEKNQESSYTYLLINYYYYWRTILIETYEFEPVEKILAHLTDIKAIYNPFITDYSKQLRYLTKKINTIRIIPIQQDNYQLLKMIQDEKIGEQAKGNLAQIMNNIIRNGWRCSVQDLLQIAENSTLREVKYAVYQSLILFDSDQNAKQFLDRLIESSQDIQLSNYLVQRRILHCVGKKERGEHKTEYKFLPPQNLKPLQKVNNQSYVNRFKEKNVYTMNHLATESSTQFWKRLVQNQGNNVVIQHQFVYKPPIARPQEQGNDRSITRGTFSEVKNLYTIAQNKQLLKASDKDEYLIQKFLNKSKKKFCPGQLGYFLVDRMIAKIYRIITMHQRLRPQVLQILIRTCVKSPSQFRVMVEKQIELSKKKQQSILIQIKRYNLYFIDEIPKYHEINKFIEKLLNLVNVQQLKECIFEQIQKIRSDGIAAVKNCLGFYSDDLLRPNSSTNNVLFKAMQQHLKDYSQEKQSTDSEYFNHFLSISLLKSSQLFPQKNVSWNNWLFLACIYQLQFNKSKESSLNYLQMLSAKKSLNVAQFIIGNELEIITMHLLKENNQKYLKRVIYILLQFLLKKQVKPIDICYFIEITKVKLFRHIKRQYFTFLYLNTLKRGQKTVELTPLLIKWLLNYFKELNQADQLAEDENLEIQCIILLIFLNVTGKQYIEEVNMFKSLLLNHNTFNFKENQLSFYCDIYEEDNLLISEVAATVIYQTLNHSIQKKSILKLDYQCLKNIFSQLSKGNSRTRKILAQILQVYSFQPSISSIYLAYLEEYFEEEDIVIRINLIKSYLNISRKHLSLNPESFNPNELYSILLPEIKIDDKNVSEPINEQILQLLYGYVDYPSFKKITEVKTFNIIAHFFLSNYDKCAKAAQILKVYSKKYWVPISILQALEKLVQKQSFPQDQMEELKRKKDEIVDILIQKEEQITIGQVKLWISKLLSCQKFDIGKNYFNKLNKISKNQDLPEELFNIIELQRCCKKIVDVGRDSRQTMQIEEKIIQLTQKGYKLNDSLHFSLMRGNLGASSTNILKILHNLSVNQQNIPIETIKNLITIYQVRNTNNLENNKLILKTLVNTYLNFQVDEILNKERIQDSINNEQLLQIALPLILKQNFQQIEQRKLQLLKKLINFYSQTNDLNHKESISIIFTKKQVIESLNDDSQFRLDNLLIPSQDWPSRLKNNCIIGLQHISHYSYQAQMYLQNLQAHQFQNRNLRLINQQSTNQKSLLECIQFKGDIRNHQVEQKMISKKLIKIIQYQRKAEDLQKIQINLKDAKQDYMYNKDDVESILTRFELYYSKINQQSFQISNQIEKFYLQVIIIVTNVHYNSRYEQKLVKNSWFVSIVEKYLKKNSIEKELLQIYIKMVKQNTSQSQKRLLNHLLVFLFHTQDLQLSYQLLSLIYSIFEKHRQIIDQLSSSNIAQLQAILVNYQKINSEKLKFISIKLAKILSLISFQCQQIITRIHGQIQDSLMNILNPDEIQKNAELLAILKLDQAQIMLNMHTQKIIYSILLMNWISKITIDQVQKVKMHQLWLKQTNIDLGQKIQILKEVYMYSNIQEVNNVFFFLRDILFNPFFKRLIGKLISNIKNHQFKERKLINIITCLYLQQIEPIQLQTQYLLQFLVLDSKMEETCHLFESILSQMQKQQLIKRIYQINISLKQLFDLCNQTITLHNVKIYNIMKKIKQNLEGKFEEYQNKMKKILNEVLQKYTYEFIRQFLRKINDRFQRQLTASKLIQIFEQIAIFKGHPQRSINQSLDHCSSLQYFPQKLIQRYISNTKTRNTCQGQDSINKVKIFPKEQEQQYKDNVKYLKQSLNYIKRQDIYSHQTFKHPNQLSKWEQIHYQKWAKQATKRWEGLVNRNDKQSNADQFDKVGLRIVKAAIYYNKASNTKTLRDNQIISCLIMLKKYQSQKNNLKKGKLFQISTGEGKSIIISVVAILLALKGYKINIVTTTSILAERDVKQFEDLYRKFSIRVADNIDRETYTIGPKKCYECSVVYGQVSQFQFDYLRHSYNDLNTLGNRKNQIVVVDEVDSMLIDDSSKIAKISSNIAAMDKLQIFYLLIWQRLINLKQNTIEYHDKFYIFDGELVQNTGTIKFSYTTDKKEQIQDIRVFLEKAERSGEELPDQIIKGEIGQHKKIIQRLLMKIKDERIKKNFIIPVSMEEFIQQQFPRWIESALLAYQYQENIHYVIENNAVSPVDYDNTGKIEHSTHWGNGLHQFLQLKHFLKITPEDLTTNFISNIKYFQLYDTILGVTGTLGSKRCQEVLCETYHTNIIIIPDSIEKQLIEYPLKIAENTNEWVSEIKRYVEYELHKERGVLIICETIEYCNYIYYHLSSVCASKITLYTMNNKGQEKDIQNIKKKEIIIATNLAGRGTDIKTEDIEANGGLHVLITFLPKNLRVQDQVKGRSSRNGNNGSFQIIINKLQISKEFKDCKENILQKRDAIQLKKLNEFMDRQKKEIAKKDQLFQSFCKILKEIKEIWKKQTRQYFAQGRQGINGNNQKNQFNSLYENTILALQERWAISFNSLQYSQKIITQFASLKSYIQSRQNSIQQKVKKLIKNPYYLTLIGYDLLNKKFQLKNAYRYLTDKDIEDAFGYFLNDENIVANNTGLGQLCLKLKRNKKIDGLLDKHMLRNYKQLALLYYQKGLNLLKNEMKSIELFRLYSSIDNSQQKILFYQTSSKNQIMAYYQSNIRNIISEIRKSNKQISISSVQKSEKFLFRKNYQNLDRKLALVEIQADKSQQFQLCFHSLNSNENNQATKVLQQLKRLNIKDKKKFLTFKINSLSPVTLSEFLMKRKYYSHLKHKQVVKIIKEHKDDDQRKPANYIIVSKIENKTQQFNKNNAIKYLTVNKERNHTYDLIISDFDSLYQQFIQVASISINCKNVKNQQISLLIKLIKCQSFSMSTIFINTCYTFQEIRTFLINERLPSEQVSILIHPQSQDTSNQKKRENMSLDKYVQFDKMSYQNNDVCHLSFKKLSLKNVKAIATKFSDQSFAVSFKDSTKIQSFRDIQDMSNIEVDLKFHNLRPIDIEYNKIKKILQLICKAPKVGSKLQLIINGLSKNEINMLMELQLQTQDVQIFGKRNIYQLFPRAQTPYQEIYQYMLQGIQYTLVAKERKAKDIYALVTIGAFSTIQLLGGVLLTCTGVATCWGIALILESIVDIITFTTVAVTRQFNPQIYFGTKIACIAFTIFLGVAIDMVGINLMMSTLKSNGIKVFSQIATNQSIQIINLTKKIIQIRDSVEHQQIQNLELDYRKIIQEIILKKIIQYFANRDGLKSILQKMLILDEIDQNKLWERKLSKSIRLIVHSNSSETMQLTIQKFAKNLSARISRGQNRNNFEQFIFERNNQDLTKIINRMCLQFEIKSHQMEKSMLKLSDIINKYTDSNQETTKKVYKHLKSSGNFIHKVQIINIRKQIIEFEYEVLNKQILLIDLSNDNQNSFFHKYLDIWLQIREERGVQIVTQLLSKQITHLLTRKLMEQIANPLLTNNDAYTAENVRKTFIQNRLSANLGNFESILNKKCNELQLDIFNSNQQDLQSHIFKYSQLSRDKPASPIDMMFLLDEKRLKIRLVNNIQNSSNIINSSGPYIAYSQSADQSFKYEIYPPFNNVGQEKKPMDEGFFEISKYLRMDIFSLRKLYSQMIIKNQGKFVKYLRSYYQIYKAADQQIIITQHVGFNKIISNYRNCSLLKEIAKVKECIEEYVLVETRNEGTKTVFVSVSFFEHCQQQLKELVKFIVSTNVEASYINSNEKVKICQRNPCSDITSGKIKIKVILQN